MVQSLFAEANKTFHKLIFQPPVEAKLLIYTVVQKNVTLFSF